MECNCLVFDDLGIKKNWKIFLLFGVCPLVGLRKTQIYA